MTPISIDDAVVLTERSKSTLWRMVAEGTLSKVDASGKRTMLSLEELQPLLLTKFEPDDLAELAKAASGNVEAQADIGQMLTVAGKATAGFYWLEKAAEAGNADAMQWLSGAFANGRGVKQDEHLALMWLAKAAAHGHVIAKQQLRHLPSGLLP